MKKIIRFMEGMAFVWMMIGVAMIDGSFAVGAAVSVVSVIALFVLSKVDDLYE